MRPQKLTVSGPRLVPVATPQPLPMRAEEWFEAAETLARVVEQLALLRAQDLKRPSSGQPQSPKS
jgi:hypothetical protein